MPMFYDLHELVPGGTPQLLASAPNMTSDALALRFKGPAPDSARVGDAYLENLQRRLEALRFLARIRSAQVV